MGSTSVSDLERQEISLGIRAAGLKREDVAQPRWTVRGILGGKCLGSMDWIDTITPVYKGINVKKVSILSLNTLIHLFLIQYYS